MSAPSDPVTYYTALNIAVLRNQPDMVELLVRHGADINRRDRVRASPALKEGCGRGPELLTGPRANLAVLSRLRSTRAAPWTWPARSRSACPACNASWTSEQTSMRPTSMVGAPGEKQDALGQDRLPREVTPGVRG